MKKPVVGMMILLAASCGSRTSKAEVEDAVLQYGHYEGLLPAADCPGIEIKLDIMQNGRFEVVMNYIERESYAGQGEFVVTGNVLSMIDDESHDTTFCKIGGDSLIILDNNRRYITSPFSDMYVLRKK